MLRGSSSFFLKRRAFSALLFTVIFFLSGRLGSASGEYCDVVRNGNGSFRRSRSKRNSTS